MSAYVLAHLSQSMKPYLSARVPEVGASSAQGFQGLEGEVLGFRV